MGLSTLGVWLINFIFNKHDYQYVDHFSVFDLTDNCIWVSIYVWKSKTGLNYLDKTVKHIINITWESAALPCVCMIIAAGFYSGRKVIPDLRVSIRWQIICIRYHRSLRIPRSSIWICSSASLQGSFTRSGSSVRSIHAIPFDVALALPIVGDRRWQVGMRTVVRHAAQHRQKLWVARDTHIKSSLWWLFLLASVENARLSL